MLVPPGEVLLEAFLKPMGVSQYRLALAIGVPESRINASVKGRRAITADTDLRLCRFFGLSEGFWLRMQSSRDLRVAKHGLGDLYEGLPQKNTEKKKSGPGQDFTLAQRFESS